MNIFPAEIFDCTLLHPENETAPADRIRQTVLTVAAEHGIDASTCQLLKPSTDQDIYMFCGGFRILITQSQPLAGKQVFERAARTPFSAKLFPQAERAIASARNTTTVSIGKGLIPASLVPDHLKEAAAPHTQRIETLEDSQKALSILGALVDRFLKLRYASAVYWHQSGYLLPPDVFSTFALSDNKMSLYVRPHVYVPPQDQIDEDRYVGVTGAGSQYLTGYLVHFVPSTAPVEFMLERLLQFTSLCVLRELVIPDGETFGIDTSERIRVLHEKTPPDEPDRINLKLEMSAAFGITARKTPVVKVLYGPDGSVIEEVVEDADGEELNPDDPVDAAILARLAELKADEDDAPPAFGRRETLPQPAGGADGAEAGTRTEARNGTEPSAAGSFEPVAAGAGTPSHPAAYVPPMARQALQPEVQQTSPSSEPAAPATARPQQGKRLSVEELRRIARDSQSDAAAKPRLSPLERLTALLKGK